MNDLFVATGMIFWGFIATVTLSIIVIGIGTFWSREIHPSLANLWFAFFGKGLSPYRRFSYYKIWSGMAKWHYRYYTRGNGNKHFARLAMKKLLREARKESKNIKGKRCIRSCRHSS